VLFRLIFWIFVVFKLTLITFFESYKADPPQIKLLGKDYHPMIMHSSEFIIDGDDLSFLISDGEKNLHMLAYDPDCN
jgi:hypothetical protein